MIHSSDLSEIDEFHLGPCRCDVTSLRPVTVTVEVSVLSYLCYMYHCINITTRLVFVTVTRAVRTLARS
jgi:hypothetical protein